MLGPEVAFHHWSFYRLLLVYSLTEGASCFVLCPQTPKLSRRRFQISSASDENDTGGSVVSDLPNFALRRVMKFGQIVSTSEPVQSEGGMGGKVYDGVSLAQITGKVEESKSKQVWSALATLERDMQSLDRIAAQKPQLSILEASLLSGAVLSAGLGPLLFGGHITEFLAPAAAAFSAAIGIGAEFTGKVAVADGKEVAAAAMQCAAEAEGLLANAERAKAICPLCVGIGASAATLALLVPVLLDTLGVSTNLQLMTEIYLFCPLVAVLAAAVASLALQETQSFASRAIGVGNRRFARSGMVGRTWMSTSELIDRKSTGSVQRWKTFSLSVLPAPVLGSLVPGALPTKTIIIAAIAAAQSAYFLTLAENVISRAVDAVALKARSAAVCDTYANQGARSSAILPFTSALASLCAAATAALVELPFVESLAAMTSPQSILLQMVVVSTFPTLAALISAAASVSKARCMVDAEAAKQAACTLALQYNEEEEDPVLKPLQGVRDLIRLTIAYSLREPLRRILRRLDIRRWYRRLRLRAKKKSSNANKLSSA
ncbi:hypothetical protein ACA910_018094 [Epithemia clementina (nom. ined.)]